MCVKARKLIIPFIPLFLERVNFSPKTVRFTRSQTRPHHVKHAV